jgi:hypothetical protein
MPRLNVLKYNFGIVLCGHETWFFTLREENGLKMFKNRVLRMYGFKMEEVI